MARKNSRYSNPIRILKNILTRYLFLLPLICLLFLLKNFHYHFNLNLKNLSNISKISTNSLPKIKLEKEINSAVLVPFNKNCWSELSIFIPFLNKFLNQNNNTNTNVKYQIYIINQIDNNRFNRGALLNIGYLLTRNISDFLILHDVDLLPLNPNLLKFYAQISTSISDKLDSKVVHISPPEFHPKYNFQNFIGGIISLSVKSFENLNGFSNNYWGWGKEDDDFHLRIFKRNMTIIKPKIEDLGSAANKLNTFRHIHNEKLRPRDKSLLGSKRLNVSSSGISDLIENDDFYQLISTKYVWFGDVKEINLAQISPNTNLIKPAIMFDVELYCDDDQFICTEEQAKKLQDEKNIQRKLNRV